MVTDVRSSVHFELCVAVFAVVLALLGFALAPASALADDQSGSDQAAVPADQQQTMPNMPPDSQGSSDSQPGTQSAGSEESSSADGRESQPSEESAEDLDQEKEAKKKDAEERRAKAESIYAQIGALQADIDRLHADYEAARKVHDETIALRLKRHMQLSQMSARLDITKAKLSGFVVDMYKQGGMVPYYEVLLKSTSHVEFLSSWYMMNEVSHYGRNAISSQEQVVNDLKSQTDQLDAQVEEAENTMRQARVKLARAELTRLALAPQAASLKMEAAELAGDEAAAAAARAELEQASRALDAALAQGLAGDTVLEGDGMFTNPCPGAVYSSGFGYRSFDESFHKGLDMAIAEGTPYYAAESGTVVAATNDGGYNGGAGNWVVIDHGEGLTTKYMHSLVTFVKPGDHVERGQNIGLVGNTGNSFGAHLHFQVEINGVAVNPVIYL